LKISEKKLKVILPFGILIVGALITLGMVKSRSSVEMRRPAEFAPLVRVVEVTPQDIRLLVKTQGTVKPRTEGQLVAEVAGQVIWVSPVFAAGGFFEKGEVLVSIDARDYELAVVTAKGQVAQAKVRHETEEAQAKVAREEWEQLGTGGDSPLATRELQLQEAGAALAAAQAALERAERNLQRTRIRAPYAGRVRAKLTDIGEYLAPGVPVASVFSVDYAEIRLPIPDAELAYVDLPVDYRGETAKQSGPVVHLYADFAGSRHHWEGRIVRVEGEIDPQSRMIHAIAQVADPYGRGEGKDPLPLAVGLFVEAQIEGHRLENVYVIPRSAMRGDRVLVVDGEDRLRFRDVEILRNDRTNVVISAGLSPGERVSVSTMQAVSDGMKVRSVIVNGENPDGEQAEESTVAETGGDS
jgi:membrane fusion protein, multidrug efflux system